MFSEYLSNTNNVIHDSLSSPKCNLQQSFKQIRTPASYDSDVQSNSDSECIGSSEFEESLNLSNKSLDRRHRDVRRINDSENDAVQTEVVNESCESTECVSDKEERHVPSVCGSVSESDSEDELRVHIGTNRAKNKFIIVSEDEDEDEVVHIADSAADMKVIDVSSGGEDEVKEVKLMNKTLRQTTLDDMVSKVKENTARSVSVSPGLKLENGEQVNTHL